MLFKKKKELIIEPISVKISVDIGTTILDAILKSSVKVNAVCGGKGTCGQCKIQIAEVHQKSVSPITEIEKKKMTQKELFLGFRLACQTKIQDNLRIYLSDSFLQFKSKILEDANKDFIIYPKFGILPRFWKIKINLEKLASHSKYNISDFALIKDAIKEELPMLGYYDNYIETHFNSLKKLSYRMREEKGIVTVTLQTNINSRNEPIMLLNVESGDTTEELFGVAFDIGTTTIVGYLVDLFSGEVKGVKSMLNPQTSIGEDIITRINYAAESKENQHNAKNLIHSAINKIIDDLVKHSLVRNKKIVEITVVGNTAMHHLLFGLPVKYLGRAPYPPVLQTAIRIRNYHLNLKSMSLHSEIYSPPLIAGFVGADTMADVIALRMDKLEKETLLIDIGTNGELVLGSEKSGLSAASCAAGSAFEGAHISCGMRGSTGAIEKISINPKTFTPKIQVIENWTPIGLCGSAILDVVAEFLKTKVITRSGKFNVEYIKEKKSERFRKGDNGWEYVIHSKEFPAKLDYKLDDDRSKFQEEKEIIFTQEDVRQIQKAKGAFLAGIRMLLLERNMNASEIEQIYIAGAFGTYIDKENAKFIGLFPDIDLDKIHQIGNAAGEGAKALLLNTDLRELAMNLYDKIKYVEIANMQPFQREFAESMIFPHNNLEDFPSYTNIYEDIPIRTKRIKNDK